MSLDYEKFDPERDPGITPQNTSYEQLDDGDAGDADNAQPGVTQGAQVVNTECIDAESIKFIKQFILNWHVYNSRCENFFTQIKFKNYLMRFSDRHEYMIEVAKTSEDTFVNKFSEMNRSCLESARMVEHLAEQEYDRFKKLSDRYHGDVDKYRDSSSLRISMKGLFGKGTKSKYEEEIISGFPPCLYWTMYQFAKAILIYENKISSQYYTRDFDAEYIQSKLKEVELKKLLQLLPKLPETIIVSGGSRRHTRRHHRGYRHHSTHSRKSVKRSKKGKKIMKSHTRKRYTRVRKQNKRRNRSRK